VLVRPNDGAVDNGVFIIGVGGQVLKDAFPYPGPCPTAEPPVRVFPVAKSLWQIAPRNSGTVAIQNRFAEALIVLRGDANRPACPGNKCLIRSHWSSRGPYRDMGQPFRKPTPDESHKY